MKDFLFGATATNVTPYSKIDNAANCNGCHDAISFHGGGRLTADTCLMCHATPGPAVNYRTLLHGIHADAFPVFPNGAAECAKCHGTTNVFVPTNRSHPKQQTKPAQDWNVACTGCHTSPAAGAHADTMVSPQTGNEACVTCHGPGKDLDAQQMHKAR
jgi:OmcA/MtrC family decaheme c-type cytochrome